MRIRKLTKAEHGVTRILWEEVFTEDEDAFLDYYYEVKATENTIYVIEDDAGDPLSMLQLNPYSVRFGKKDRTLHYIVAVATREKYRGRGYMRELLETSASEMYRDGEPFTFLMPAAEAIYYPHGFRFVYRQRQIDGKVKDGLAGEGTVRPATLSDCPALARFAEEVLSETEWVRAVRTEEYYRTLVKEQQSEGGRILVTECKGQIRGFVLYGYWEGKARASGAARLSGEGLAKSGCLSGKGAGGQAPYHRYSPTAGAVDRKESRRTGQKRCADDYGADCAFGTVSRKFSGEGGFYCQNSGGG